MPSEEDGSAPCEGGTHVWIDFQPPLHPCSIDAYCSSDSDSSNVAGQFLCGQYELDEGGSEGGASREGSIHVCTVNATTQSMSYTTTACKSGVLDLKVAGDYVASAQSEHSLWVHRILRDEEHSSLRLEEHSSWRLEEAATVSEESEGLFLSVDWDLGYHFHEIQSPSNDSSGSSDRSEKGSGSGSGTGMIGQMVRRGSIGSSGESNPNIAVSTQEGSLIVYELSDGRELSETFAVNGAHKMSGQPMPAWIVCFDPHSKTTLVSGGDDCLMKLWDLRQGTTPTSTNKQHNAGVTSAQWHPQQEHLFATGSYDEYVRVWDQRALRNPVAEIHACGGVWRTKWNIISESSSYLFLSCMQGGSAILEYDHATSNTQIRVAHTDKSAANHLAYGIDLIGVKPYKPLQLDGTDGTDSNGVSTYAEGVRSSLYTATVATCSFYDNKVQIWNASL